jgi:Uma2 family endonuclease
MTLLRDDQWVQMPATWEAYTALAEARGERAAPRYTFLDGRLTALRFGLWHEMLNCRLTGLLDEILVSLNISFHPTGRVTLQKPRPPRVGTEGDASYYLSNLDRIHRNSELLMGRDPAPDLMIEVVLSHFEGDAIEVYRQIGVREVWVCREKELEFLVLGTDGRFTPSPTSSLLPFLERNAQGEGAGIPRSRDRRSIHPVSDELAPPVPRTERPGPVGVPSGPGQRDPAPKALSVVGGRNAGPVLLPR